MRPPTALPSLGRCPLLLPLLGAVGGILVAENQLWPLLVVAAVAGIYLGLLHRKPTWLVGVLALLGIALLHQERLQEREELAAILQDDLELPISGTIVETNSAGLVRRLFETENGARILLVELPDHFQTGQKLLLLADPLQKRKPRNPSGWNPDETLWKKGIAGSVVVISAQQTGWSRGFPLMRGWSEDIRDNLTERVTSGIHDREAADIVQAVILGQKPSGSQAFEDFRKTGTMHIFAVSGLHVGLVATIVFALGWALRIPPRTLLWIVILSMFGYAFITGLRPPALRASLMGSLLLGRFLLYRRPTVVNNLFAAGIVVLALDSFQLWQAGFQLSFVVVGIILLLEPSLWKRVGPLLDHDPFLPKPVWTRWQHGTFWVRNKVGKMFTVSSAAWAGSAPLSLLYFGWFTPIAAFASVLMVMVAFLILVFAFLGLALGSFSPVAGNSLNAANGLLAKGAQNSANKMSEWPGAWTRLQPPSPWQNGLCAFDIKYGGAAVHLDAGGGVLIDAGSEASFWWDVEPALDAYELSFDSIIATHNDASHIGGFTSVVQSFPIKQALIPNESLRYSLEKMVASCEERNVSLHTAHTGHSLTIDPSTRIEILTTGQPEFGRVDDRGLVLMVHLQDWKILITADGGYETERLLLESGQNLDADIWICGRNEKDSMGQDAFIRAVSPSAIIASEQAYPSSEQIPQSWRNWLESEGIAFYSQREHGAVFVKPSDSELVVTGFLTKKKTILTR